MSRPDQPLPSSAEAGSHGESSPALGLGGRLLRSTGAATFSQVWRFGVTLATHAILRKLVVPADWGLWHWADTFLFLLLVQVRDLGLSAQVVRDQRRPYGNFLAVELGWGALLSAVVFFASPLLALAYSDPDETTVAVVRALCLFLMLEGLGRVPHIYFEAELRIDRALVPELVRNLCFAGLSIGLALGGYGVWSLVVAHIAASGVFAALLWIRALPTIELRWIRGETWSLVRKSLPLMVMALLLLAIDTIDIQVLSLRFSEAEIGMYGAALTLALLMPRVVELPVRRALYPAFVAVRDDAKRFFETYHLATILLMAVQVPFALFLFVNAELLLVLYGSAEYAPAAPWLQLLCLIPLVQPFARCAEDVILARHEERVLIAASLLTLASLVGFGLWFSGFAGPGGMAWAKLVPLGALLVTWSVWRVDPTGFGRLAAELVLLYALPLPLFAAAWYLGATHPWLRLGLSIVAGLVAVWLYFRRWGRSFWTFFQASG